MENWMKKSLLALFTAAAVSATVAPQPAEARVSPAPFPFAATQMMYRKAGSPPAAASGASAASAPAPTKGEKAMQEAALVTIGAVLATPLVAMAWTFRND